MTPERADKLKVGDCTSFLDYGFNNNCPVEVLGIVTKIEIVKTRSGKDEKHIHFAYSDGTTGYHIPASMAAHKAEEEVGPIED